MGMEKKTIGKFISALRRASGMTQRELGEKLFVSDKTVSRWERDECTPELSLIPVIAEIFGVTTDELLRGERNSTASAEREEPSRAKRERSEKQVRNMVFHKLRTFRNLSLISIGIALVGLLAAVIVNCGLHRAIIAFCVASAFYLAALICQVCFTSTAKLPLDGEDSLYDEAVSELGREATRLSVKVIAATLLLWVFTLPVGLVGYSNAGLAYGFWLWQGALAVLGALVIAYLAWVLFLKELLAKKGFVEWNEAEQVRAKCVKRLLIKTLAAALSIAIVFGLGVFVLEALTPVRFAEKDTFDNWEDFAAFMEEGANTGYVWIDNDGNVNVEINLYPDYNGRPTPTLTPVYDDAGKLLCEYIDNPRFYEKITFNEKSPDKLPVTVITRESYLMAMQTIASVQTLFMAAIAVEAVVCAAVYLIALARLSRGADGKKGKKK